MVRFLTANPIINTIMLSTPDDFDGIWEAFAGSQRPPAPLKESSDTSAAPTTPQGFSFNITKGDIVDFLQAVADERGDERVFDQYHAEELLNTPEVYKEIAKEFKQACVEAFYEIVKETVYHEAKLPTIYKPDQDELDKLRGIEDGHRDNEDDQRRHARSQGIY